MSFLVVAAPLTLPEHDFDLRKRFVEVRVRRQR